MGLIVVGALMIAFPLSVRIAALRAVRRSKRAMARPRSWVLRSPGLWAGVVVVTIGINQTAGSIAFGVGMVVLLVLTVRALVKAPGSIRRGWRHIGDPDSWRGKAPNAADR
jgi:O-antigen/teichoic acid export membrane protein